MISTRKVSKQASDQAFSTYFLYIDCQSCHCEHCSVGNQSTVIQH